MSDEKNKSVEKSRSAPLRKGLEGAGGLKPQDRVRVQNSFAGAGRLKPSTAQQRGGESSSGGSGPSGGSKQPAENKNK